MAKKLDEPVPSPEPDWSTPAGRVQWLVKTLKEGNRAAFAEVIGFSHTAINKVMAGQPPGRKMLAAIAKELKVSSDWLLSGTGQPFTEESEELVKDWMPIAETLLPGPPKDYPDLLSRAYLKDLPRLFTPSQYWYRLGNRDSIVQNPARGFRVGDLLLLETARDLFPRERAMSRTLCVVRFAGEDLPLKLALVNYVFGFNDYWPDGLSAKRYDQDPDPDQTVKVEQYLHYPTGEVEHRQRVMPLQKVRGGKRPTDVEATAKAQPVPIRYADVVAVWTQILYRAASVSLE